MIWQKKRGKETQRKERKSGGKGRRKKGRSREEREMKVGKKVGIRKGGRKKKGGRTGEQVRGRERRGW